MSFGGLFGAKSGGSKWAAWPPVRAWAARRERRLRNRFAERLRRRLDRCTPFTPVQFDAGPFLLRLGDGRTIGLANFWFKHRDLSREARTRHIESIAQSLMQAEFPLPEDYEDVRVDLMPKIWPRSAIERSELAARVEGDPRSSSEMTPLGSHLLLGVVYDLPKSMRRVWQSELQEWDATFYEAMEQAVENLKSRPLQCGWIPSADAAAIDGDGIDGGGIEEDEPGSGGLAYDEHRPSRLGDGPGGRPGGSGFFVVMSGDAYDAPRMLLVPDLIEIGQFDLKGPPVAMVPCRDALLFAGSDDAAALETMAEFAQKLVENEPQPLAPTLLRHVDGTWEDWHVPSGHPAAGRLHQLELQYLKQEYDVQKTLLETIEQQHDEPADVGELMVFRHREGDGWEAGRWASATVWGRHVRSLLPKADYIALVDDVGSDPVYVPWDDVVALTGELMQPLDLSPPRWRVAEFPHPKAIEILAETASNPMADTL